MKPVLIIRHAATEGPGFLGDFLTSQNIPWVLIKIDEGEQLPTSAIDYSGVAMMGGPMSVNDDLPWIAQEVYLIQDAVKHEVPLIGHCLGGQLMSKALGAKVSANKCKEIGWGSAFAANCSEAKNWFGEHS